MPVIPPATTPTSDDVYGWSRVKWAKLGITSASDLDEPMLEANAYLVTMTGRYFTDWPAPTSFEGAMPLAATPELIPLARQALRMRVEQIVLQKQPGYVGTVTDDALLSMSVGSYSETRRDPTRRGEEKILNLWTGLNDLLWALMTEERFAFWLAFVSNQHAPAFAVEEVNWSAIGKDFLYGAQFNPYAPWTMFG